MYQRFIENHVLANLTFALVLTVGITAYLSMPREENPTVNFNWIEVTTVLPGASAQDVEQQITEPIEDAIKNISDTRFVSSVSRESISSILVRFEDIDERTFDKRLADLRREVQGVEEELPDETTAPTITEITTANSFPTAMLVVVGRADDENLRRQSELIKTGLENIDGVDSIRLLGLRKPELQIAFQTDQLRELGITPADLADSVAVYYRDVSAGAAQVGQQRWLVRLSGKFADAEYLASLPVVKATAEIQIGDIAEVTRTRKKASQLVSYQGQPAVMMSVNIIARANTLDLVAEVNEFIATSNKLTTVSGVHMVLLDDQTERTRSALQVMQNNMLLGLLLVLCVTWLFLGTRLALLTSIGIPFILAGTFWFVHSVGQTLNVSVLLGIVISLGMLVDDAVVIAEGIAFRMQRGMAAVDAAITTVRELFQPVTSAVLTTIAAFLPLMLLPGILGKFMFVVPLVVTTALVLSLFEAYWMLPAHSMDWATAKARNGGQLRSFWSPVRLLAAPLHFGDWLDSHANPVRQRWLIWLRRSYTRRLIGVIRHPWRTVFAPLLAVIALAVLSFQAQKIAQHLPEGMAEQVARLQIKTDFFASDPLRLYYVNLKMPIGTPLEDTLQMAETIQSKVLQHIQPGEVRQIASYSGLMFTEISPFFGDHYGQIVIALNPKTENLRSVSEMVESMRTSVMSTPGPEELYFLTLTGGPPAGKPVSIKVQGDRFEEIFPAVAALKEALAAMPGVTDISDDSTSGQQTFTLKANPGALQRAGVSPALLSRTLRLLVDGEVASTLRDGGEDIDVRILARYSTMNSIDELLQVSLPSTNGTPVALSTLLETEYGAGQDSIRHYNFRRTVSVEANIDPEITEATQVKNKIVEIWRGSDGEEASQTRQLQRQFPTISLDFSGQLDDIEESIRAMTLLFGLGIGLMYIILGTQFRSYFQPLLILLTVPMAFIGVMAGLLVNRSPLSLYTLYGVVALAGIAVNSAIVLISTANANLKKGMTVRHATLFAARRRIVPILITSMSTIAGLFSLAVGLGGKSLLWGPIATTIVWGLGFSTLLTLFLIPLLYNLFMQKGQGASIPRPQGG